MQFDSPRQAWAYAIAKRKGRGHRSRGYSDTEQIRGSHTSTPEVTTVRRLVYGQGGDSFGVERGSDEDLTLQTWASRKCHLCGGHCPLDRQASHRCQGGPNDGRLFWTEARVRLVRAFESRLRRHLRAMELLRPKVRLPKLRRAGGELESLAPPNSYPPQDPVGIDDTESCSPSDSPGLRSPGPSLASGCT